MNLYEKYTRQLECFKGNPFSCPHCGDPVAAPLYERHCTLLHSLDADRVCVWCRGRLCWPRGEKARFAKHLLYCWLQFQSTLESKYNLTQMCLKKQSFGHSEEGLHQDPLFSTPADPLQKTFGQEYLDLAVSYLEKYCALEPVTDWLHVMVRAVAMPSFERALHRDEGRTTTLPFWCWCDGGPYPEVRYRQHRHMIVVSSPKGHFMRHVWSQVKAWEKPYPHFPCRKAKWIQSKKHLINTLGYVSHRQCKCNFGADGSAPGPRQNHHFYIYTPLPSLYKWALALLYEGGLLERVSEQFGNLDPSLLTEAAGLAPVQSQWQLPVQDIPGIPMNIRVGVTAHVPGQRLYVGFERVLTAGETTCLSLYQTIGHETWVPSPHQQEILTQLHAAKEQWKAQLEDQHQEIQRLEKELRNRDQTLAEIKMHLERKDEALHRLKRKLKSSTDPWVRWTPDILPLRPHYYHRPQYHPSLDDKR